VVKEEKIKAAEELKELIENYETIGMIEMNKMPTKQLQEIRKSLEKSVIIKMVKKSTLLKSIEKIQNEDLKKILNFIPTQPAILLTNIESFKLYLTVSKLAPRTYVKEGDILEEDVIVNAGPTDLSPGPVISELSRVGIKTRIEGGKISISEDCKVAKKGDKVNQMLASVLRKLNVKPKKIRLNIIVIYEKGKIYTKDLLELVNIYPEKIKEGYNNALNLSTNLAYPTRENIKYLLIKAINTAKVLEKIGGVK
jgi:large subunit ribosomal protein L10